MSGKSGIRVYNRWGDPHQQARRSSLPVRDAAPHGLTHGQIEALDQRAKEMLPPERWGAIHSASSPRNALLEAALPPGRAPELKHRSAGMGRSGQMLSMVPGMSGLGSGSGSSLFTTMKPYQPEFESPDRQMFPVHRRIANTYWRLFNKMDPTISSVIELFSQLPWGDFQLAGEGVDGEVKEAFEYMIDETGLRTKLPQLLSEYLIIGEAIPHLFFDDEKGIWTHIALHNPDQVNVVYSPFIKMDTIMELVPDKELRELVISDHPMLARVRETMPPQLVAHLRAGQNIPLSPVNASFIARKLQPYDLRGTSVMSRLWRTLMLEDAIWSATIQTARRAAAPIKALLLGDPTSNVIPPPAEEKKIAGLLAQAENDPQAWFIYNYQAKMELWGAPERIMSINQHYELIDRIKLEALGVSKSFISGETSYSSAASGLTVFLQRLKAYRDFFVNEWLIPKFFLPVAVINEWIKPSKAQASGGHVRVKQSARELSDKRMYILPTLEWAKSLDPTVDKERIDAMTALEKNLGIKITDQRKYAAIGLDAEETQKQLVEETKFKRDLAGQDPYLQMLLGLTQPAEGGGGEGGVMSPGVPPEAMGMPGGEGGESGAPPPGGEGGAPPMPEGAAISGAEGKEPEPAKKPPSESKHWGKRVLDPLLALFEDFDVEPLKDADVEPWVFALKDRGVAKAIASRDPENLWMAIENWLIDENYPSSTISDLEDALAAHGKLQRSNLVAKAMLDAARAQLGVESSEIDPELAILAQSRTTRDKK